MPFVRMRLHQFPMQVLEDLMPLELNYNFPDQLLHLNMSLYYILLIYLLDDLPSNQDNIDS